MKEILIWVIIAVTIYFIAFTLTGILEASVKREFKIAKGCIYKSYLSLYNPAFRFGCALARDRTN